MNVHLYLYIIRLYMYDKCFAKWNWQANSYPDIFCAEGEPHSCKTHNVVYFTEKSLHYEFRECHFIDIAFMRYRYAKVRSNLKVLKYKYTCIYFTQRYFNIRASPYFDYYSLFFAFILISLDNKSYIYLFNIH